jgi:hypothetical protein
MQPVQRHRRRGAPACIRPDPTALPSDPDPPVESSAVEPGAGRTEGTGAHRNGIGKFLRTMVKSLTFMITLTSRRKIQIQERQANVAKLLW